MRVRTRRLRSLLRGIVVSPLATPRATPQQRAAVTQGVRHHPGVCPPLPREDSGWGEVVAVWRGRGRRTNTMRNRRRGGKGGCSESPGRTTLEGKGEARTAGRRFLSPTGSPQRASSIRSSLSLRAGSCTAICCSRGDVNLLARVRQIGECLCHRFLAFLRGLIVQNGAARQLQQPGGLLDGGVRE